MTENDLVPTEMKVFPDGTAALYTGRSIGLGEGVVVSADYMTVKERTGFQDELLIYSHDGLRSVLRLQQAMTLDGANPAVPVTVGWGYEPKPVEAEDEKRFLAIYDHFEKRTWR